MSRTIPNTVHIIDESCYVSSNFNYTGHRVNAHNSGGFGMQNNSTNAIFYPYILSFQTNGDVRST